MVLLAVAGGDSCPCSRCECGEGKHSRGGAGGEVSGSWGDDRNGDEACSEGGVSATQLLIDRPLPLIGWLCVPGRESTYDRVIRILFKLGYVDGMSCDATLWLGPSSAVRMSWGRCTIPSAVQMGGVRRAI